MLTPNGCKMEPGACKNGIRKQLHWVVGCRLNYRLVFRKNHTCTVCWSSRRSWSPIAVEPKFAVSRHRTCVCQEMQPGTNQAALALNGRSLTLTGLVSDPSMVCHSKRTRQQGLEFPFELGHNIINSTKKCGCRLQMHDHGSLPARFMLLL